MSGMLEPKAAKSASSPAITITRPKLVAVILILLLVGGVTGYFASRLTLPQIIPVVRGQTVRNYTLIAQVTTMTVGTTTWDTWTYNGTVPGPTLIGKVGDTLRVTLINQANLIHSIHTHLTNYNFSYDGSQANVISGVGAGSMVPPGGFYVYEYPLTTPGIYYYHCHSADGNNPIQFHIKMGLYGTIVVNEVDRPPAKEFAVFYAEGQPGSPAPYVINNRGVPGGEHTLEQIFADQGLPGVIAQLNVTVTTFKIAKGDVVRLHIVNIGDLWHSHHHHGFEHRSIRTLRGDVWAGNVLPLMPGQADTLEFTATQPGLWLFHCHVVSHADAGMIGILQIE